MIDVIHDKLIESSRMSLKDFLDNIILIVNVKENTNKEKIKIKYKVCVHII